MGIPLLNAHDRLRPTARKIDSEIPDGYHLAIYDPDYQPLIFYLQTPYGYTDDVAAKTPWVLARAENRARLSKDHPGYIEAREFEKPFNLVLLRLDPLPPPERKVEVEVSPFRAHVPTPEELAAAREAEADAAARKLVATPAPASPAGALRR